MKPKVAALTAIVLMAILLVLDVFIYFTLQAQLLNAEESVLQTKAQSISETFSSIEASGQLIKQHTRVSALPPGDGDWLRRYGSFGLQVVVVDTHGTVLSSLGRGNPQWLLADFAALRNPQVQTVRLMPDAGLFTSTPITSESGNRTIGYVLLRSNISKVREYMHSLLVLLIAGSVGAILLAALGGYVISALAIRPINQMIRMVQRIQWTHLNERLSVPRRRDEVAELASTFNTMLERMERSYNQQSRFVADASHEILTPLTTIQGYANLLARWGKDNPEILHNGIQVIRKESARLQELADDLLTLAEVEVSAKNLPRRADPVRVMDEVVDSLALRWKGVTVVREVKTQDIDVAISPSHLRQIFSNLIENAVKYSERPIQISLLLQAVDGGVQLQVADSGRGIPTADLPYIFDRFYRVDKSRGRRQGGSGLGLAIVRELIEAYHGTIRVDSEVDRGTTFVVTLPAAGPDPDPAASP